MTADNAGNVYAAGDAFNTANARHGIIREKLAGSSTWTTVFESDSADWFEDVAVDPAGTVYAAG